MPLAIFPMGSTFEAARGLASVLAGVGPKKMQIARPGGQYAISPTSMSSRAVESSILFSAGQHPDISPHPEPCGQVDQSRPARNRLTGIPSKFSTCFCSFENSGMNF